ncbi:HAD hydrolase subfamily IA REG-2-like protein [Peniophora sp. CONT]|nr:HAD hydrolase subfamily IA REG-2-like protein [Peniophora sp. CONT]
MRTPNAICFVTFDALYTIIKPRAPIPVQYAEAFATAGLGTLDPQAVGRAFKDAYKHANSTMPAGFLRDESEFWCSIISQTATGAGADVETTEAVLPELVPTLMRRFSTGEGYELYDDVMPSVQRLDDLRIKAGLISNSDSRILSVLSSLGALTELQPVIVSGLEKAEKPNKLIFQLVATRAGLETHQSLHIGDELESDYRGAEGAGMKALLLRRLGKDNAAAHVDMEKEDMKGVAVVHTLTEAVDWVEEYNKEQGVHVKPDPNSPA